MIPRLKNMELAESDIRDAIWAFREYDDETLLGTWDKELHFGYGKRIFIHYDGEDEKILLLSRLYTTRAK